MVSAAESDGRHTARDLRRTFSPKIAPSDFARFRMSPGDIDYYPVIYYEEEPVDKELPSSAPALGLYLNALG